MSSPVVNHVIAGFSTTNRWLLYASLMFSPTQFVYGIGSNAPFNLGFLGYNIYQQYLWYHAAKLKQLHALSLLPLNLNLVYAATYLCGVPSGNVPMGIINALGTTALVLMNTATAWVSWKTNMQAGYGVYQFFFFGWHILTPNWHKFFGAWQAGDTLAALFAGLYAFNLAVQCTTAPDDGNDEEKLEWTAVKCTSILWGPLFVMATLGWTLIMFIELIVKRNNIVSETDMVAVYLFIVQAVLMVIGIITDLICMC